MEKYKLYIYWMKILCLQIGRDNKREEKRRGKERKKERKIDIFQEKWKKYET